jgi:hypothetical protein
MIKIIRNPYECGYCDIEANWRDNKCKHPKKKSTILICEGNEFPKDCPLENGTFIKQFRPKNYDIRKSN